ncbi:MAG TPA: hypothetical protein VLW25_12225 [Bryobacteraceae bacterium]|nr:hypothetical protein [Bryobacteraceae bacterium]
MSIHRFLLVLTLGLSGICTVMAQPPTAAGGTRQFSFPPAGLAFGETMQVNLFNQAASAPNGTAASCTGTVSFLDLNGKEIPKSGGKFTVASGDTQPITLLGTAVNTSMGGRAEIRAVVSLTITHGTPCWLVQSLETYDSSTGATHVYLTGPVTVGPIPASIFSRD